VWAYLFSEAVARQNEARAERDRHKSPEQLRKKREAGPRVQIPLLLSSVKDSVSRRNKRLSKSSFAYEHFPICCEGSGLGWLCLPATPSY
jgi:hypothetical protein